MIRDGISRRSFLNVSAKSAIAAAALGPSIARGSSDQVLRLAQVGCAGMGNNDYNRTRNHSAVKHTAFCDVDENNLRGKVNANAGAKGFNDYRKMFDEAEDDFDAVVISTPDHMHAPIAMRAMLSGKHVYCQKPLTQNIPEARLMQDTASRLGLVCQMGIQVHADLAYRLAPALIKSGIIGKVKEVHSWSFKDWGGRSGWADARSDSVPGHLNWDAWVGVSPWHDYAGGRYHSNNWRRWVDFGCGTQGDMAPHMLDPVYNALDLGYPTRVWSAHTNPYEKMWPNRSHCRYRMPGTPYTAGDMDLHWYDGGPMPDRALFQLEEGRSIPNQGSLFIGEKGNMLLPHVGTPQFTPEDNFPREDLRNTIRELGISGGNHYHEWVNAVLADDPEQCSAGFDYSAPLTELCLIGTVASRFGDEVLNWDADSMQFTNKPEARQFIRKEYRDDYEAPDFKV